jgi:hypothetical protein
MKRRGREQASGEKGSRLVELTDEGYRVLEIVRRVLRQRTHWATWGQTLMAAIETEVQEAEPPASPARPR